MASGDPVSMLITRYDGLRCHLCGKPINKGEYHAYTWRLGAVHVDDRVCQKNLEKLGGAIS